MNILIVHNYYQITGGEDTVVYNEKQMLEKNGHTVLLYARHNSEIEEMNIGYKILNVFRTIYSFKTYREIRELIKNKKIDIIHCHNTFPLISPSVYKAANSLDIPVIQTVHNFRLQCPGGTFYRGQICTECQKYGLKRAIKYKCYRNNLIQTIISCLTLKVNRWNGAYSIPYYICLTEFNKEQLLKLNTKKEIINPNKVFIKPNFSINDAFLGTKDDYYIYAGRIEKLKGIQILVDAFMNMPSKKIVLVGDGKDYDYYKRISEKYDNIIFKGKKTHEDTIDMISKSKALILPSQCYEGFPMTIVESMSVGTPVICSNLGNMKYIIKDGVTGLLFDYNSSNSLIDKIQLIEKMNIKKMQGMCLKEYKERYNENVNYCMLLKIYNSLTSQ